MMQTKLIPKILIISSAEIPETQTVNNSFVKGLNSLSKDTYKVEWCNYLDIGLKFGNGHIDSFLTSKGYSLNNYRLVYFKSYFRYYEQAAAIAEYLEQSKIAFIGHELRSYVANTKLTQMARLARNGFDIPKTFYLPSKTYVNNYGLIKSELGSPFIFKAIDASSGNDNYLIRSQQELEAAIKRNSEAEFIAQTFIPNRSDYRILVVGGKPKLVIERKRLNDKSHLNNTSQGASASLVKLTEIEPALKQLAIKAAKLMDREIAGVDIMLETGTKKPFILEVNASPQVGSGAFEEQKLELYNKFFADIIKGDNHA